LSPTLQGIERAHDTAHFDGPLDDMTDVRLTLQLIVSSSEALMLSFTTKASFHARLAASRKPEHIPYENEYCFVFEIEGGKIRRIREYVDTQKAKELLFD
jgi:ketosteroid isomerase-like protein